MLTRESLEWRFSSFVGTYVAESWPEELLVQALFHPLFILFHDFLLSNLDLLLMKIVLRRKQQGCMGRKAPAIQNSSLVFYYV